MGTSVIIQMSKRLKKLFLFHSPLGKHYDCKHLPSPDLNRNVVICNRSSAEPEGC